MGDRVCSECQNGRCHLCIDGDISRENLEMQAWDDSWVPWWGCQHDC